MNSSEKGHKPGPKLKLIMTFLVIGAVLTPLILSSSILFHQALNTFEREIHTRNSMVANSGANEVSRILSQHKRLITAIAKGLEVKGPDNAFYTYPEELEFLASFPSIKNILLLDKNGRVREAIHQSQDLIGLDLSGEPYIQTALGKGHEVWSDIEISPATGHPEVHLAIPSAFGLVVGTIDLSHFRGLVLELLPSGMGYAFITDQHGFPIVHPDEQMVVERYSLRDVEAVRQGLEGSLGCRWSKLGEEEVMTAVAKIPGTNWLLVLAQPKSTVLSPLRDLSIILWSGIGIVAILSLTGFLLLTKRILGPFDNLKRLLNSITQGKYPVTPLHKGYREIDEIGNTLLEMADAIRQREEGLKESERKYRELYDSVSDLIYTQDLNGNFTSCNRTIANLFGYEPEEFIGRKAEEFMKPEFRPLFYSEYLQELKTKGFYRGISAYFRKDGKKIYLEYSSRLVRPETGEPYISGIARDVTEKLLMERELKRQKELLEAILKASPDPIVALDVTGNILFMNEAFINKLGYTHEDLKDGIIKIFDRAHGPMAPNLWEDLIGGSSLQSREVEIKSKDGRALVMLWSASQLKGPKGNVVGVVITLKDITDRVEMEKRFLQMQKMEAIALLVGGIAHNFNNLLTALLGNLNLIEMKLPKDSPLRKRLKDLENYAQQGADLTRQLLGFARGGKYVVKELDLNRVLQNQTRIFAKAKKEITFVENYEPGLWIVEADEGQISQVLMNLYINAADAMPNGGTITISTRNVMIGEEEAQKKAFAVSAGPYVEIAVQDTGIGMDEVTRSRIFEPFFTTKGPGKGTGLGLASVYGIVKNHHGFIEVDSEVGKGSVFRIYLPAKKHGVIQPETKVEEAIKTGKGNILLIDDEDLVLVTGKEMLEHLGYNVTVANSGKEALSHFRAHKDEIDLVILDMIMPDMGGGEVFNALKDIKEDVRVILSSGYSIDSQAKAILNRGCKGFIQKPFGLKELGSKVAEALEF